MFFAGEDIYRDSLVGTRELAIKKHCKCRLELDESRTFESYCFEFCGLLNLRFTDIKFMLYQNEVTMSRTVKKPCEILVHYSNTKNSKGHSTSNDFFLGPAYSSLLETGLYSDIEIEVNGETLRAHKCILTARSEKFRAMLLSEAISEMVEQRTNKVEIMNKALTVDTFK